MYLMTENARFKFCFDGEIEFYKASTIITFILETFYFKKVLVEEKKCSRSVKGA